MHPEIVDDRPGACPICKMPLEPVRLDTVWSCPVHAIVAASEPGRCSICGRELVRVTVAVAWTCADAPGVERAEPGACPGGAPARVKYTPRPHGNHNPQHGGQFFMAADTWHHLEGVYPREGIFRLHVYDDYSRPLPEDQLRRISARVRTPADNVPLKIGRGGAFLEARVGRVALPAQLTANVRFTPGGREERFDFTFAAYSSEVSGVSRTSPPDQMAIGSNATGEVRLRADTTYEGLLAQLRDRSREIAAVIDRGALGEVYVPAFAAKDLALGIDARARQEAAPRRLAIEAAVLRLVRATWSLDAAGDIGNRDQIAEAYGRFAAALAELEAVLR